MFKGKITDLIRSKPEGREDWEGRNVRPQPAPVADYRQGKHVVADMRAKLAKGAR